MGDESFGVVVAQLRNDELLLDHLDLLIESLELVELEMVEVLEEDPDLAERSTVEVLHQALDACNFVTSEGMAGNSADVGELSEQLFGV